MSGHNVSEVLDSLLAFQNRCAQIAQHADNRTHNTNENKPQVMYMGVCNQAVDQCENHHEDHVCRNAAEETFHGFFRADFRAELVFAQECSGEVCAGVCHPSRTERQDHTCQTIAADVQQCV